VAISPVGERIVTGSGDGTVRVWDARSGAELAVLRGHEGWVTSVAISPDGERIVSTSGGETVRVWVWDTRSGECLDVIQGSVDVQIAADSLQFPLRFRARGLESVVERADNGEAVAWFPVYLDLIASHPSGSTWAGDAFKQLYLVTLEGRLGSE
jgi:WD40 repeat protein